MDIEVALAVFLPYGKFKGKVLDSILPNYLKWVAKIFKDDTIAIAADVVWRWRESINSHFIMRNNSYN